MATKPFWLSWESRDPHGLGTFELSSPWWISGYGDDSALICAAVMAEDEDSAIDIVIASFDEPRPDGLDIDWRFVNEREPGWSPFSERFPKADWMVWP